MDAQRVTDWSAPGLEARCDALRASCLARGVAEPLVLAVWPGGSDNAVTDDLGKWVVCYGNLMALFRMAEERHGVDREQLNATLAAALAREPASVRLASGRRIGVYPKSYHALRFLDMLDTSMLDAARMIHEAEEMGASISYPLVESLATRLWVWILTHEEPGLPFDEAKAAEPPEWTKSLEAADLITIADAHRHVNGTRCELIARAFPSDPRSAESRLSLAGFLGASAQEMGVPASDLIRRFSLGELFAQSVAAGQAAREARAAAKDKSAESGT